jgi:hypothetical protein
MQRLQVIDLRPFKIEWLADRQAVLERNSFNRAWLNLPTPSGWTIWLCIDCHHLVIAV